jgi:hypothetical protein
MQFKPPGGRTGGGSGGARGAMSRLGLTNEPVLVRARIATAADFLERHDLNQDYLKGIDFSKEVHEVTLDPGFHLIAYRPDPVPGAESWNPFGLFYTEVGTSAYEIGIKPDKRIYVRYIVEKAARALKSRAAGIAVTWAKGPRYLAGGGGWQYIVPGADNALRRI